MPGFYRDNIRSKVYSAEHAAWTKHPGKRYESLDEVKDRVFNIVNRKYVRKHYRVPVITVAARRADAAACCESRWDGFHLKFPNPQIVYAKVDGKFVEKKKDTSWAWCDWVICHEIAHALTEANTSSPVSVHGRQFVRVMLDLVRNVMGREAHDILKAEFRARKVPTTKPRAKRTLTDDDRAMLQARMAKARAARDAKAAERQQVAVTYDGGYGRWSVGRTEDGSYVVVGPDGKRRRSKERRTAYNRVETEAKRERTDGVACPDCGQPCAPMSPYHSRRNSLINSPCRDCQSKPWDDRKQEQDRMQERRRNWVEKRVPL